MSRQETPWHERQVMPNPFIKELCCKINLTLPKTVIAYFEDVGRQTGWPAERIIELYLRNMAFTGHKIPLDVVDNPHRE
ncbi:hypothetical protein [Duganella fentianensis]|uniref:hypothetical protein n=1 Tax=Duganella fentianensis TaxID=2692177 RepID=UPI0032B2CA47